MRAVRIACLALAVSLAAAGSAAADPALDKLIADWMAAFEKGDAKALTALYTNDAVRVTSLGGSSIGRAAIEKEFTANFAGPWKGTHIKITAASSRTVAKGVTVAEGTWTISGVHGPDGKPMPDMTGNWVNTHVWKNGALLIASNTAFQIQPPPK